MQNFYQETQESKNRTKTDNNFIENRTGATNFCLTIDD